MQVYLDSCIIIYLIEGAPELQQRVAAKVASAQRIFVSQLSRLECRVGPLKSGDAQRLADYDHFFSLPSVTVLPLDSAVVDNATDLRVSHGFKTPDALHVAAAVESGCEEFWTNDLKLAREGVGVRVSVVG